MKIVDTYSQELFLTTCVVLERSSGGCRLYYRDTKMETVMRQFLLLCVLSAVSASFVCAQAPHQFDPADEIQTCNLKGLKAVGVVVAELNSDLERSGLFQNDIKTDTEMRLKQSGIRVLTGKQRLQTQGRPYLYISITSVCQGTTKSCVVDVGVRLMEDIQLERDSDDRTNAAVWRRDVLTTVEKKHLDRVRGLVAEFVEQFKAAVRSANPS